MTGEKKQEGAPLEVVKGEAGSDVDTPRSYRVVLLNDDYTTMEFVVEVLMKIFNKNPGEATEIMLNVHRQGKGICGVYTLDIARSKVNAVRELARTHEFPLQCIYEQV